MARRESAARGDEARGEVAARAALAARLRGRQAEIEQEILARVYGVGNLTESGDPSYAEGLRAAVRAALDCGLAAAEHGTEASLEVPPELLTQARLSARSGVSLDTVLRRYFAGFALLGDFIAQEVVVDDAVGVEPDLQLVWKAETVIFDRMIVAVTDEYTREVNTRLRSTEQRRTERVRSLLTGDLVDVALLGYEFDCWHIGAIAVGAEAGDVLRELAALLDRRLLLVRPDEETVWAWLGGRSRILAREALARRSIDWPDAVTVAIGEPARGIGGWRFTHRQAKAAIPVARRGSRAVTHYAEVSLVASMLQDEVLTRSLRDLYLLPLVERRDSGRALCGTLRAYFEAERNVSSTAAALGVDRKTVNNRLRLAEERIGQPLTACAAEIEAALRLEELRQQSGESGPP